MSTETNTQLVKEWVRLWNLGDADGLSTLYHDEDFSWRISGLSPASKKYSKEEIIGTIRTLFARPMIQPHRIDIRNITAEDDRVALEFVGRAVFDDGTSFLNYYHTLFFIHDGKIAKGRAYLDTWVALQSQLAPANPN
jgi:ketosteroid isomerase-like protein